MVVVIAPTMGHLSVVICDVTVERSNGGMRLLLDEGTASKLRE
jgi:hypothetical protein